MTSRQFINILLILSLLLLSGSIFLAYKQVQQLKEANAWMVHTYQVLSQSNKTLLTLNEAELLVNDYVDLEDSKVPVLFKLKINSAKEEIEKLAELTTDDMHQQRKLALLKPNVLQKINLLLRMLTDKQIISSKSVRAMYEKNMRDLDSKINSIISDIQESELVLIGVRGSAYQYNADKTNLMLILTGILGNVLLLITFILLNYFLSKRDYAERQRQKIESNLERIIDSSHDLIAAIDPELRFTAFNTAYEKKFKKLFGKDIKVGMDLHDVFPNNLEGDTFMETWERALHEEPFTIIHRFDDAGNESHYYEATYNPIYDANGTLIGACQIMRDVSARRKVEQLKNEFVSVVSHELRVPLTSIQGSLGLIMDGALGNLDDKTNKMLNIAYNHCGRLVNLITNILEIEKIESGKLQFQFETLDLNKMLEEAASVNQADAEKSSISLKVKTLSVPVLVQADHDRLIQLLTNLITNAIKCSKPDGQVFITLDKHDAMVRVSIRDQGKGVSEELAEHIFKKFSQKDISAIRKKGGTGLGLSISKAIVERHNGTIGFKSEKNKGSVFYFDLPLFQGSRDQEV